ncbi:MAG: polyprenyl synthetase family protein, partial [Acidobacteria bacterium]|nr:polyprenyl synthetase family protein [Acidobacteriota bacterium]
MSTTASSTFQEYLSQQQARIEEALERLVPPESEYPPSIHQAMRYSL